MNSSTIITALVTEAFISTLQDTEPALSPAVRAAKAARFAAGLSVEETLDILNEA